MSAAFLYGVEQENGKYNWKEHGRKGLLKHRQMSRVKFFI